MVGQVLVHLMLFKLLHCVALLRQEELFRTVIFLELLHKAFRSKPDDVAFVIVGVKSYRIE